ncbi:MAG: hypothetical protein VX796_09105 [Pseudomonadota bacterium]|nr:hypothetical protein [Pseudomonadota bacterium]
MIDADEFRELFDEDEVGVDVTIAEPGVETRFGVSGMWSTPEGTSRMRRAGTTDGTGLRVGSGTSVLQLFNADVPRDWRNARVTVDGVIYSITQREPFDRLRTELWLVPYGDRHARKQGGNDGRWISPKP